MNDLVIGFWLALLMFCAGIFSTWFGYELARGGFESRTVTGLFAFSFWIALAATVLQL